jgi:hypothetical protein
VDAVIISRGFNFFMTDFNKTQFYCSRLGQIMVDPVCKTPFDSWKDACILLEEEEAKYSLMLDKTMKSAQNKLAKIEKVRLLVQELEPNKDTIVLADGCKSYLTSMYGWLKYKKWNASSSGGGVTGGQNSANKGVLVEGKSIEMINILDGTAYQKNEKVLSNEWIIGIPDIVTDDYVIDVKSSWNIETFLSNLTKEVPQKYFWQMQGYMMLTGAKKSELSYCLVSTPEEIIQMETERIMQSSKKWTEKEIRHNLTFDDIPVDDRRIKVIIERDEEAIQRFQERILVCRQYLSEVESFHFSMR